MGKYDDIDQRAAEGKGSKGRLPAGVYPLRIMDYTRELSKKGNPMWVLNLKVFDRNSKYHGADIKIRYLDNQPNSMNRLFSLFQDAGANLTLIRDKEDKGIEEILNAIVDAAPVWEWKAVPQKDNDDGTPSIYNNWYAQKITRIGTEAPAAAPVAAAPAPEPVAAPAAAPVPEKKVRPNPFG